MLYKDFLKTVKGCPFCNLPKEVILKDNDSCLVMLCRVPYIKNHLMVIPKRHVSTTRELKEKEKKDLGELFFWAMEKIKENCGNFSTLYREGDRKKVGGSSIEHLHIHVVPEMKFGISSAASKKRRVYSEKEYLSATRKLKKKFD